MVLGTFLPLCMDGAIQTPAGGVVVTGLAVCCTGLIFSVQSLQLRDRYERTQQQMHRRTMFHTTVSLHKIIQTDDEIRRMNEEEDENSSPKLGGDPSTTVPDGGAPDAALPPSTESLPPGGDVDKIDGGETGGTSTLHKVVVCFLAGVFASQLQFAFVFGDSLVDLAESDEGPGSTPPSGTGAIIWLFAISLGTPASILYGLYSKSPDISLSRLYQCPWYRHVLIILTTSIPWVAHIHLYGFANTYLPSKLGASVAWPVLMMTTVVAGMIWSILLGEWALAPQPAKQKLYQGLALVSTGVVVIMASVAI
jgi:hypothetical protein